MKQSEKFSIAAGILLLSVAALFIISLMLHFLNYGVAMPYFFEKCQDFGTMLFTVYGIASFLIPVFLFVASIFLFLSTWNFKRGLYLAVSLVPFFTIVGIEKFCNNFFIGDSSTLLLIKYTTLILVGALLVVIEYLIVGIIADSVISKKIARENQIKSATQRASVENLEEDNVLGAEPSEVIMDGVEEVVERIIEDDEEVLGEPEEYIPEAELEEVSEEKIEFIENPDDICPVPEQGDVVLEYGDLHSEYVDIPNSPDEIIIEEDLEDDAFESKDLPEENPEEYIIEEDISAEEDVENPIEEVADIPLEDKKRITPEEIDALLSIDEYPDEPEVIQMDFNLESKPEMQILPEDKHSEDDISTEDEIAEPVASENQEVIQKKGGLLSTAMKLREDLADEISEDISEVSNQDEIQAKEDAFDKAVFGDDDNLKDQFFSEDEQNFLNNPFGENPNNPFDFLGEAGKDIKIEEDELLEESDEIGAFEFDLDDVEEVVENQFDDNVEEDVVEDLQDDFDQLDQVEDSEEVVEDVMEDDILEEDESEEDVVDLDDDELDEIEEMDEEAENPYTPDSVKKNYNIPIDGVLASYENNPYWIIDEETKQASIVLKETLSEFKIEAEVTGIRKGPVVTMFEILPAPGVKLNKIVALQDNIALRLAAQSVRIVAPIPGKHAVGIEVPNKERAVVSFRELIEKDLPQFEKMKIPVVLGKDISGDAQLLDLATTPHLLIAGSTGSGKSVCVNSMILSILYKRSPKDVKMILIDPKIVELKLYNDIPHLLTPVITEPKKAFQALQYCLCEMERRYAMLDHMGVRDISTYNKRIKERHIAQEKMPYIVVVIDEFADLMATTGKELETTVARLAAMSRAVGIHLVLATQRPSIDVITGLIKANIPTRIAFMVASKTDSRIIIDQVGSEKLLGKGDMLYASAIDPFPVRIQGTFVTEDEVEKVVECVKSYGEPEYIDEEIFVEDDEETGAEPGLFTEGSDPLYDRALEIVVQAGKASASYIQRRLKIGYNRAARLVEEMEARGIVGPANGSKPREIIHIP